MKASNLRNILNPLDQQNLNAEYTTAPPRTTTPAIANTTSTTVTAGRRNTQCPGVEQGLLSSLAPRSLTGLNDGRPSTAAAALSSSVFPPPHRFPPREERSISPRTLPQATQDWERQRLLPAINGLSTPHASPRVLPLPRDMTAAVQQQQQQQQQQSSDRTLQQQSPASSRNLAVTTPQTRHSNQEYPQLTLSAASSPWSSTGHGATPRRLLSPFGGDLAAQGSPSPFASSRAMSQPLDRQQTASSLAVTPTNSAGSGPSFPNTTTRGRPPLYSRGFWIRDEDAREPVIAIPLGGDGNGGPIECTVDLKQGSAAADAKRRRDARAAQRCRDRKRMHNLKTEQELARCQRRVAQLSHELEHLRRRNRRLLDMMPPALREDAERGGSPVEAAFSPDD